MSVRYSPAALRGAVNREAGSYFEQIISSACFYYQNTGVAEIEKTPEPIKRLGRANNKGQFLACYEKKGQPDYKGTVTGGGSVVFEAKHTSLNKISQSVVLPQQAEALERHRKLGATTFILVSFALQRLYKIPWEVWRNMKELYGRKYLTPDDIPEYEVHSRRGVLDFLPEERISRA